MGRGKGQTKTIKKNIAGASSEELGSLFNQLLGDEKSLDPVVIMEKYNKLRSNIETIKKLLEKFINTILLPKFNNNEVVMVHIKNIEDFIEQCQDLLNLEATSSNVIHVYKEITRNNTIKLLLITCQKLRVFVKNLENIEKLSCTFINSEPGITLELFAFTKLNFKTIVNSENMGVDDKKYVLIILSMICSKTYDIYNLVTSPDVDIEKFSNIIIASIQEAKKSIPRCEKAFKKIAQSVDLLKSNFNNYYKDFIESESPSIIIENFVMDISKNLDSDMETTRQFKKIVMFYQKRYNSAGKNKDPRLKEMFSSIQDKFKILETEEGKDDSCEEDDGEEEGVVVDVKE